MRIAINFPKFGSLYAAGGDGKTLKKTLRSFNEIFFRPIEMTRAFQLSQEALSGVCSSCVCSSQSSATCGGRGTRQKRRLSR